MRRGLLVIVLAVASLACPAPAMAARAVSYAELLAQVKSGPLIRAIINRSRDDIEIKFRDLSEWEAFYPPGAQRTLQRLLHKRGIRVIFASRHRAGRAKPHRVHHHLRYIAAGVIGVLALIGGAFLYLRRRRPGPTPGAGAPLGEDPAPSP